MISNKSSAINLFIASIVLSNKAASSLIVSLIVDNLFVNSAVESYGVFLYIY